MVRANGRFKWNPPLRQASKTGTFRGKGHGWPPLTAREWVPQSVWNQDGWQRGNFPLVPLVGERIFVIQRNFTKD